MQRLIIIPQQNSDIYKRFTIIESVNEKLIAHSDSIITEYYDNKMEATGFISIIG